MRVLVLQPFCGVAGDMAVGALLDLGAPLEAVERAVASLPLEGVRVRAECVERHGLAATHFSVEVDETAQPVHRSLADIFSILEGGDLAPAVLDRAKRVFTRLAEAEGAVHGAATDAVHFHDVGAADAIVEVVAAAAALEALGVGRVLSSPVAVGEGGVIETAHGVLPVPSPATAKLLEGFPVEPGGVRAELATPTGAAILTALAEFAPFPPMRLLRAGAGAGTRELPDRPNVLRAMLGEAEADASVRRDLVRIECAADDLTGERAGYLLERLYEAGALEVLAVPATGKKSRPTLVLSALAPAERADDLARLLFGEGATLGLRMWPVERRALERDEVAVETDFGPVRVKRAYLSGEVVSAKPEHDDCARLAREKGVPLRAVFEAALAAARQAKAEQ